MTENIHQLEAVFARHQTFHPRYGWLTKGISAIERDGEAFSREDAMLTLGVGKNMVDAIRFWCEAFGVIEVGAMKGRRVTSFEPSEMSQRLLSVGGLDPYLESTTTLWILHWKALQWQTILPVWFVAMSSPTLFDFTENTLLAAVRNVLEERFKLNPTASALKKDVSCLLRMYTHSKPRKRESSEDILDSQFRQLNLIRETTTPGVYNWVEDEKPGISSSLVRWTVLDYMSGLGLQSATLEELTEQYGSPGRILKLKKGFLADMLRGEKESPLLSVVKVGDTYQVMVESSIELAANASFELLSRSISEELGNPIELPKATKGSGL